MRKYSRGNGITDKLGNDDEFSESDYNYCRRRNISEVYHTIWILERRNHYCKLHTVSNIHKKRYFLLKRKLPALHNV